ncbi:SGNH/GDSL hydrolase family protein [Solihabitans fulvus]|uniref:SGNH/GDSL hydrolase family protein n=1 Tax=Solihabitans fulvus TaxID=1892852 RepID=A0A5B2WE58_9PSEU|nr:SGNH/GDSL hydrolase family protein [Solihabitans fulvus]KAA2250151.1 SGNH/GDSL hydrolase family protein [Solihabitans fulvus]
MTAPFTVERDDPYTLSDAEADVLLTGAPWRRVAVLGDSLAEGLGEPVEGYETSPWADRVVAALRRQQPDLEYLNLGVRNLKSAEVRANQLAPALEFKPDLVMYVAGGNDLFVPKFDPAPTRVEVDAVIEPLRAGGAEIITFTLMNITAAVPEIAALAPLMEQLNRQVVEISEERGALLVDMWNHPVSGEPGAYSSDKMHASMRGHAVLAAEVIRRLGARLAADRDNG